MEQLSSLSEIKQSLPGDVAKQLRNVSLINMCRQEHFPDELSCIKFAQGFGLIPTSDSQILHCEGNFCRFIHDTNCKVGYTFVCYNKKSHQKEKCLTRISPLENTLFKSSHLTIHDTFKLIMCFVSQLTVAQVEQQLSLSSNTVINWYVSFREVCKVVLANEFHGMIHRDGEEVVDESPLYLWKYGLGRKRKWDNDSPSNEERIENYQAESEYRRRYFCNMYMESLPLDDQFLMFCYHIKLVFPGRGKIGLMYPMTETADDCSDQKVNDSKFQIVSAEGKNVEFSFKIKKVS